MLKPFTYNYVDIDYKGSGFNHTKINTIGNLQDKCTVLKPGKGQGVVSIKKVTIFRSKKIQSFKRRSCH